MGVAFVDHIVSEGHRRVAGEVVDDVGAGGIGRMDYLCTAVLYVGPQSEFNLKLRQSGTLTAFGLTGVAFAFAVKFHMVAFGMLTIQLESANTRWGSPTDLLIAFMTPGK